MTSRNNLMSQWENFENSLNYMNDGYEESFEICIQSLSPPSESLEISPLPSREKYGQGIVASQEEDAKINYFLNTLPRLTEAKQIYRQQTRQDKLNRYRKKKLLRKWSKKVSYVCRHKVAIDRQRVKGRFISIKKEQNGSRNVKQDPPNCPLNSQNVNLKCQVTESSQS